MNETIKCPQCGKPVPQAAPGGLCPECMLKVGAAAPTEEFGPEGTRVLNPLPREAASVDEVAKLFPHLEILACLGRGGMGVVYRVRQPKLNRLAALKILAPEKKSDPKFAERFTREAQALARLNHPNIVAVHDFGETEGVFYLLMEFVDGVNLRKLMQDGRVAPEQALAVVPSICDALQYAHEQGIVHRDIKPENVLLDKEGRVKIADFGIAKLLRPEEGQPSITEDGTVGTPHYMAPEQVEQPKTVDHRADIYSLGVVFYEMLTGELPLGKFAPPSRKVQIDVRLDEVVLHALEKEPNRRYQQVSQVKTDVETISTTRPGGASAKTNVAATPPSPIAIARKRVGGPGIGLILSGILNWVCMPLSVLVVTKLLNHGGSGAVIPMFGSAVVMGLLPLLLGGFMIYAGLMMRRLKHYPAAISASVGAILFTLGNPLGLPIGIWALVVLCRQDVRAAFRAAREGTELPSPSSQPEEPGGGRSGAGWVAAGIAVLVLGVGLIALLLLGGLATVFAFRATYAPHAQPLEELTAVVPDPSHDLPMDADARSFGPVHERLLHQRLEGTTNWFLDLETGNLLMPPPALAESMVRQELTSVPGTRAMQFADWVKQTGVDLAVYGPEAFEALGGIWVWAHGATYEDWDDLDALTPAQMLAAVRTREGAQRSYGRPQIAGVGWQDVLYRDLSVNYFFKTRDGTLGVLQVVGRDEATGGLKLRYKLAEASGSPAAPQAEVTEYGRIFGPVITHTLQDVEASPTNSLLTIDIGKFVEPAATFPDGDEGDSERVDQRLTENSVDLAAGTEGFQIRLKQTHSPNQRSNTGSATLPSLGTNAAARSAAEFGPVMERVLSGTGDQNQRFIDFDTGRLIAASEFFDSKDEPSPEQTRQWWGETGVDAMADTVPAVRGLLGLEMAAVPVPAEEWERATPARLDHYLEMAQPGTPATLAGKGELPVTFAIKTREGAQGLVQITGVTDRPSRVSIRYKLVQTETASPGPTGVRAEVLRIQLQTAQRKLVDLEKNFAAGVVAAEEVDRARTEVEVLQGQLEGDAARVAAARFEAARRHFELVQRRFDAGRVSRSELDAAQAEMEIRALEAQAADSVATRVQLMERDSSRGYWRWRIQRGPGARIVYGVLDVTDPDHPKQVLMGRENIPLTIQSSQDYALRLNAEADDWRVEVETAWVGESGGRGSNWDRIDVPPGATLRATLHEQGGELTTSQYHVFWLGDLEWEGHVLKRLRFVARLADADDPVQNILDETDSVRTFDLSPGFSGMAEGGAHVTTHRMDMRPKLMMFGLPMLVLLLFAVLILAVPLGGAAWWIAAGTRTGSVMQRSALALAAGGPLFSVMLALVLSQLGIVAIVLLPPAILACEIPAFCLGLMSRQSGLGKASMIVSATIVVVTLVFLL